MVYRGNVWEKQEAVEEEEDRAIPDETFRFPNELHSASTSREDSSLQSASDWLY